MRANSHRVGFGSSRGNEFYPVSPRKRNAAEKKWRMRDMSSRNRLTTENHSAREKASRPGREVERAQRRAARCARETARAEKRTRQHVGDENRHASINPARRGIALEHRSRARIVRFAK